MRVVKADEALAVRRVERQRIADAMRSLGGWIDTFRNEFHPVIADRIDDENDAIEREKIIEPNIAFLFRHRQDVIIR